MRSVPHCQAFGFTFTNSGAKVRRRAALAGGPLADEYLWPRAIGLLIMPPIVRHLSCAAIIVIVKQIRLATLYRGGCDDLERWILGANGIEELRKAPVI